VSYIIFFAVLTVVSIGFFVLTHRQLGRARSWVPAVASSVRASEGVLVFRRAVLFGTSLVAAGGLIAMINAHDTETWTDGEVLGVARDAAASVNGNTDSVTSPVSSVNAAIDAAMRDADGPGLLTTDTSPAAQDGTDDEETTDGTDNDEGSATSYVISYHGEHAACLTVTAAPGPGILVPVPGGGDPDDASSSSIDTYDLTATATAGAC
jgi:hypothetical protein